MSASDAGLPVAATVVLVRDGAGGPEVLMVRRPERGSFAGAWVFPGGKVDDADGEGLAPDAQELALARRAAVRETHEEVGLTVAEDALLAISCWVPPQGIPLRIRTWFFACPAPAGEVVPQVGEVEEFAWIAPGAALERHGRGEFHLYPPTWVTLYGMSDQPDAQALLAEARLGGVRRFETHRDPVRQTRLLWRTGSLDTARLPWEFTPPAGDGGDGPPVRSR